MYGFLFFLQMGRATNTSKPVTVEIAWLMLGQKSSTVLRLDPKLDCRIMAHCHHLWGGKILVCSIYSREATVTIPWLWVPWLFSSPKIGHELSTSHSSLYPWHWTQGLAYCWYSRHACRIIRWSLALRSPENLSLIVTWSFLEIKMWASASYTIIATAGPDSNVRSRTTSTVRNLDRKQPRGMPTGNMLNLLTLSLSIQSCLCIKSHSHREWHLYIRGEEMTTYGFPRGWRHWWQCAKILQANFRRVKSKTVTVYML